MRLARVVELCDELCARYDALIGVYLDGSFAMGELARSLMAHHSAMLREIEQAETPANPEALNPLMTYNGMAEDSSGPLHHTTVVEYIERNTVDGANWELLAQLCLVMAYQYWEDHTRVRIAEATGRDRNSIVLPIMGELRHLRRSIVHNSGRAVHELERNEFLPVFEYGAQVVIGSQRYLDLMFVLKRHVRDYAVSLAVDT